MIMSQAKFVKQFRVDRPKSFRIADIDPSETYGLDIDKAEAKAMIATDTERLVDLQKRLYAQNHWAVLIILQAMDAAGKDSVIDHVMSGINPQGCDVHSFKAPSTEERDHDFLWRTNVRMPERGKIGIFNRSYYEEVLVVRVHPEMLESENLPPRLITKHIWKERFDSINALERHLSLNGTLVLKFHLRISKAEQKRRLLERFDDPAKRWKFSMNDVLERRLWDRYMDAYEDAIRHTSSEIAPWYVVPSDNKWFARLTVAAAVVEALEQLDLKFPEVKDKALIELQHARRVLTADNEAASGGRRAKKAAKK